MSIEGTTWRNARSPQLSRLLGRLGGNNYDDQFTPNDVLVAIGEFEEIWPRCQFGPGHIVLSDFNLESDHIGFCIREAVAAIKGGGNEYDMDQAELLDLIDFLAALLELDEDERVVHGEEGCEYADAGEPPFA